MDGELSGGNMNAVIRDGDTVLRRAGLWTPTVHHYLSANLAHLAGRYRITGLERA